jgi:tRNA 5-methylaminomethyl-2-thiouridine biosynthesis bifunctional protein
VSNHTEYIAPAEIRWQGSQPYSTQYDDIYFSADGNAEVQRVFMRPSNLIERARDATTRCFTVAELGFGSGLNFFVCADSLLRETNTILHFISVEAHPFSEATWQQVARLQSNSPTAQALAAAPPPLLCGWHRRILHQGRVHLSIFHGDVGTAMASLQRQQRQPIDAWFLDGFAPTKNPAMWHVDVLAGVAGLSKTDTTVATFTASGQVRRDLQDLGFAMEKIDQRPFKRSSLLGRFVASPARQPVTAPNNCNVLGAGIAGAWAARQLADLGLLVNVYDPVGVASGGSKMHVSALHGRLLGDETQGAEFRARAYHHAVSLYKRQPAFRHTGALQLALTEKELAKLQRIRQVYCAQDFGSPADAQSEWVAFCTPDSLEALGAGQALGGLFFTGAGVVNLPQLCSNLLDHPGIQLHHSTVEPREEEPWIIACASDSRHFSLGIPLEIGDVWGQLDWIEPTASAVRIPIVGNGYVIPTGSSTDAWVVGSSYEHRPWDPAQASQSNVQANRRFIGDGHVVSIQHKRAARCVSSDRDPVIGRLGEQRWVSTAHGSSGTSSAPLAATIIASDIVGWIAPVSQRALDAVDPRRFVSRQARRGVKVVGLPPEK